MTTDNTELAQREKFEAWARSQKLSLSYGDCGYVFSSTEMAWRAWRASSSELVEALEKAQHEAAVDWEAAASLNVENQEMKRRIAELEDAEQKLCAANVTLDARAELAERQLAEMGSRTFTTAATDVLAERQRQITAEGLTPEHDDEYQHCEMAVAAACYIMADDDPRADVPELWPWPSEWWKPTDVRRDLVKAGALILAEIERLDRAAGTKEAE
ncbi:TPA: ead/Ea22-like family protein [Klebsiella oxytoca]